MTQLNVMWVSCDFNKLSCGCHVTCVLYRCDDVVVEANNTYPQYLPVEDEAEEFHKVHCMYNSNESCLPWVR